MKFDLGQLDLGIKSKNISWRILPTPWLTDTSMFDATLYSDFLPNLRLPGRHESGKIDKTDFFYVDVYIDIPVVLHRNFFDLVANIFNESRESAIYSDYWIRNPNGTSSHLKLPKFSFERFLANDFLGPVIAFASEEVPKDVPDCRSKLLHEKNPKIFRIPTPTYETISKERSTSLKHAHMTKSSQFLEKNRKGVRITKNSEIGRVEISYANMAQGSVSVIIPTRGSHLESMSSSMVEACVKSTLGQDLDGLKLELILVVDNDTEQSYVSRIKELIPADVIFKVIDFTPPFNFSKKCNLGFAESTGDIIVFLNDDTEWVDRQGLKELVGTALLNNVGVVGALLLYPDGFVQHAGLSMRPPDILHAYRYQKTFDAAFGDLVVAHEVSGVTGACMALKREVVDDIEGWSEEFPNSFNDVDLCFKVRDKGYSIIQANKVRLLHHESKTRVAEVYTSDHQDLQKKWINYLSHEDFMRSDYAIGKLHGEMSVIGHDKKDMSGHYVKYFFYVLKNYGLKGISQSAMGVIHKLTGPKEKSRNTVNL